MKVGKIVKTAIKWSPVLYPVVRKIMKERQQKGAVISKR